jgi:hypothetical protein
LSDADKKHSCSQPQAQKQQPNIGQKLHKDAAEGNAYYPAFTTKGQKRGAA